MVRANRHHTRMIGKVLYSLKKQYGHGPVDIYKSQGETVDMKTGVASRSADVTRVTRAVVLPERRSYNVERTISLISSDKQSVTGGYYGQGRRMFLIDQRDVDDLDLKQEDWLVYDDHKYEVKHFDEFEAVACWVVIAQRVRGEGFDRIHLTCAEDFAEVGEDASDS